ncbi:hypothetical protein CABS01_16593 [Colletotrichum abscissum]|uniref:Uncharacterized protein n=1 Tax=Colletotrichum abscissum TaxID=1671311 RepID=A0A9Q0AWI0_9PEZI|nr:uncharacterized protein CABS01_16593 [Colletotrichum abscissum]KAI3531978.1 hypothetical protein CABS02_13992 [Colletotrichum abscissum]KAK1519309.1 hypothetical protein CABS01_16593 [Colletotrichum abscissum]
MSGRRLTAARGKVLFDAWKKWEARNKEAYVELREAMAELRSIRDELQTARGELQCVICGFRPKWPGLARTPLEGSYAGQRDAAEPQQRKDRSTELSPTTQQHMRTRWLQ